MAKSKKNAERPLIIDDETVNRPEIKDLLFTPVVDDEPKGMGLVMPPDLRAANRWMGQMPSEMKLIDKSEWSPRVKEQERAKSSLSHLRLRHLDGAHVPSLDQNGHGYCWAYSVGSTVMLDRMKSNDEYVRPNPHSVASIVKKGRDEGGWCGLSAKFIREVGIAPESVWPKHSRDWQKYYTDACKREMAKYRVTEDWVDLAANVYDQNLTIAQLYTCLLNNVPCAVDFNWWSHSVCAMRVVEVEPGSFGIEILNSWTDSWGNKGAGILRGSKGVPDGAVATRVTGIAA